MQNQPLVRYDLPTAKRLQNAADFSHVFNKALFKVGHANLLLLARPSSHSCSRIGLVIAKKHVKRAVDRNRIKRIIKESFRTLILPSSTSMHESNHHLLATSFNPTLDIIVLARPGLAQLTNVCLHQLMQTQWKILQDKQIRYNQKLAK